MAAIGIVRGKPFAPDERMRRILEDAVISGFEAYGPDWVMHAADLPMPHYDYDGTSHGEPDHAGTS